MKRNRHSSGEKKPHDCKQVYSTQETLKLKRIIDEKPDGSGAVRTDSIKLYR
ncbi:MAG: hypothetical protein IJQ85_03695 [Selenomonadaceae bacterium]|nr:hypothetical protein [Selenomonadaceae bacterium]